MAQPAGLTGQGLHAQSPQVLERESPARATRLGWPESFESDSFTDTQSPKPGAMLLSGKRFQKSLEPDLLLSKLL